MTNTRIDEIRARLAATTDGPWVRRDGEFYGKVSGCEVEVDPSDPTGQAPMQVEVEVAHVGRATDAEFIAHSVDDVAYLLDQLQTANSRVAAMLACATKTADPGEAAAGDGFNEGLEHGDWIRCEAIRRAAGSAPIIDGPF